MEAQKPQNSVNKMIEQGKGSLVKQASIKPREKTEN